jgi:tRNA/tmRNA/rRNA uracil-C5-methylase (TrmA/RlmC/RlmD family)
MKLGTVTYNLAMDWDIPTIIQNCTEAKFEGVELRTTHKHGVEVTLTKEQRAEVKKRFGRAKLMRVIESSPDRVQPLCPYFGDCGGCQYQHIAYESQLAMKHKQIGDLFEFRVDVPGVPCPLIED